MSDNLSFKPIYLSQHGFGIISKMVKNCRLHLNIKYNLQVHLVDSLNRWRLTKADFRTFTHVRNKKCTFKNVFCGTTAEMNDPYHSEPLGGELHVLFWISGVAVLSVGQLARIPARGRWHRVPSMPKLKFLDCRKHRWNLRALRRLASSENCSLLALCWRNRCRVTRSRCVGLANIKKKKSRWLQL